jgi:hypothetical protein
VEQIVCAFEESGLSRSQFCQREGLKLITLNRYLKRARGAVIADTRSGGLIAVEVGGAKPAGSGELMVVLAGGRRVEVNAGFDGATLRQLVQLLESM